MGEKPTKVEVGQRYRTWADIDGEVVRVTGTVARLRWKTADHGEWETEWECAEVLAENSLTFLGYAPGYGPQPPEAPQEWQPGTTVRSFQRLTHGHRFEKCERGADGNYVALSALQVIQARKKPEPWVPSCDELHWLPDA